MKFNSMFVKIKQGDRLVYKLRDESLRCELEALNIEIINKFSLGIPSRNAIIKSLIQFLSQGSIYCNQSNVLFEKMSDKLSNFESLNLCESEEKQLLNMNIPYFYSRISDVDIKDNETIVWKLKESALTEALKKLERFDLSIMKEQVGLIEFSINSIISSSCASKKGRWSGCVVVS